MSVTRIEFYNQLINSIPTVERKGKTTPYTSINGHMFSFLSKEGEMGLRLPEEIRNEFIEKFDTNLMEQHGRIMKEYVHVPSVLLEQKTAVLAEYLLKSFEYVGSLKPKPTKKKK